MKKLLHPGAKWLFRIGTYTGFLVLTVFFGFFGFALTFSFGKVNLNPLWIFLEIFAGILFFLIILVEIYVRLAYNNWYYEFTDTNLKLERGVIWKRYSNIPYERIQNVDITRGIIARMGGFSSLNIQTAGYSAYASSRGSIHSEGYIPAVSMKEAEDIREWLMKKISKRHNQGI